jgi:hypothetical protein
MRDPVLADDGHDRDHIEYWLSKEQVSPLKQEQEQRELPKQQARQHRPQMKLQQLKPMPQLHQLMPLDHEGEGQKAEQQQMCQQEPATADKKTAKRQKQKLKQKQKSKQRTTALTALATHAAAGEEIVTAETKMEETAAVAVQTKAADKQPSQGCPVESKQQPALQVQQQILQLLAGDHMIHIMFSDGRAKIPLKVDPNALVSTLRSHILNQNGLPDRLQYLRYEGEALVSDRKLSYYGIHYTETAVLWFQDGARVLGGSAASFCRITQTVSCFVFSYSYSCFSLVCPGFALMLRP